MKNRQTRQKLKTICTHPRENVFKFIILFSPLANSAVQNCLITNGLSCSTKEQTKHSLVKYQKVNLLSINL